MTGREFGKKEVYFTAAAIGTAALGTVALTLIRRHHEAGDDVTLEGESSDEQIEADVAYLGLDDDPERAIAVEEVNAIGPEKLFIQLRRLAVSGTVYLTGKIRKDS